MPIYEYQCKDCGHQSEELRKMSDPPLKKCPNCGGRLQKLMSLNTFHLKGSGWYVTDYARKNSPSDLPHKAEKTESKSSDTAKKTETTVKTD
ncbi:MAG: zinc ribbon domain-containing protein [Thermodesulfobacteriota bacterium]|nr:zinc ribbon domain-containing protein [Thermodesulfobacteriota bacterium]